MENITKLDFITDCYPIVKVSEIVSTVYHPDFGIEKSKKRFTKYSEFTNGLFNHIEEPTFPKSKAKYDNKISTGCLIHLIPFLSFAIVFLIVEYFDKVVIKSKFLFLITTLTVVTVIFLIINYIIKLNNKNKNKKLIEIEKKEIEEYYRLLSLHKKKCSEYYLENRLKINKVKAFSLLRYHRKNTILEMATPQRGISENFFLKYLDDRFPGKIYYNNGVSKNYDKLYNYRAIQSRKKSYEYVPDFIFFDEEIGLIIDIEIDEPYNLRDKEPIHYLESHSIYFMKNQTKQTEIKTITNLNNENIDEKIYINNLSNEDIEEYKNKYKYIIDDYRDNFFLELGWCVIRFAETQIIKYPEDCCTYIENRIFDITKNKKYYKPSNYRKYTMNKTNKTIAIDNINFKRFRMWTYNDSINLIKKNYRENLLKNIFIDRNYSSQNKDRLVPLSLPEVYLHTGEGDFE